jgi:3'(2'), 5'-bisphosphate nucleotidase
MRAALHGEQPVFWRYDWKRSVLLRPMVEFERAAAITDAIWRAGQKARVMRAAGLRVDQKGPGDFVTQVDRALDADLSQAFENLFPQDVVISEENSESVGRFQDSQQRFWCVDPVDGTRDFIETGRDYAVMVGALEDGEAIAGWVYEPEADRLYYGGKGWGLYCKENDQIKVCYPQPPMGGRVIVGDADADNYGSLLREKLPEIELWNRPGSFGLKIIDVILGRAGALFYFNRRVKLWDTVGPVALAQQAGLRVCDLQGHPLSFKDLDPATLGHRQAIILGWPHVVDNYLLRLGQLGIR